MKIETNFVDALFFQALLQASIRIFRYNLKESQYC